jgi:leucyl aminopeptidase
MNNMKFIVTSKTSAKYSPDITVYCISQLAKEKPDCADLLFESLQQACKLGDFKGDEKDALVVYQERHPHVNVGKRIAFIGTGIVAKKVAKEELREKMRSVGGTIAKLCRKIKAAKINLILPKLMMAQESDAVAGLTEGIILGDYVFEKYKTEKTKNEKFYGIKEVKLLVQNNLPLLRWSVSLAANAAFSACDARNMANEPGGIWIPESFASYARTLSKQYQLTCTVFEHKDLVKMGMGGILAVNRGSSTEPKLVVLAYQYSKTAGTILLVGKGLTFDSGGISIKPAAGMEDMKYDMCGGAAVLAAMRAVGVEKPECNVVAIVPATDNMSGSSALKPGDIIFHYNKMSSEVVNTDAEGRLILADALAYGIKEYEPDCVIDLATLTGAVIIGLGHHYSGVLSNNDTLVRKLLDAGTISGEPLWRLPLGPQYAKQIESKVADMKNAGGKAGGTITAAEYLHKFVGKTPWAHLDIAGTAWGFTEKSYINDGGPSGIGVRTLVEFIRNWKKDDSQG